MLWEPQVRRLLIRGQVLVPFSLSGSRQLVVTSLASRFLHIALIDRLLKKELGGSLIDAQTLGELSEGRQTCR